MRTHNTYKQAKRALVGLGVAVSLTVGAASAQAQEILLTGPLAGARAVRKLKLYRQGRFEIAPSASFTLLDEYQRTIFLGARLNYNVADWLALGVWGATGSVIQGPTHLSKQIQDVNSQRSTLPPDSLQRRLVANNLGPNFEDQIAGVDWVASPQLTAVPFRGKLALFQGIVLDSDLYLFGGPAFVGLKEREDCESGCNNSFNMTSRMAIAPTFGLGFSFYVNDWSGVGFEWRGMPYSWNTGGFDVAGGGPKGETPDNKVNADDRQFKFNQMLSVSYNIYLPTLPLISE
ncbi:MAG: hypothetical protein SFV15_01915 [Polyangiaceae bacterium]|nr:hypothetical protein [Polyangiaceae bacterium]